MLRDIRFALRSVMGSPGSNTALFEVLNAVRLRTLPVRAPQELVELRVNDTKEAHRNWLRANGTEDSRTLAGTNSLG